ncbi:MAG: hypothetical protein AAF990_28390 [Bacteroidota bacterium]
MVPDNMKTAVLKADKYEPTINETLSQWADHYQTSILPTRSRKPRDKAIVEQAVRTTTAAYLLHCVTGYSTR